MNKQRVGDVFAVVEILAIAGLTAHILLILVGVFTLSWKLLVWCGMALVTGGVSEYLEHPDLWGE